MFFDNLFGGGDKKPNATTTTTKQGPPNWMDQYFKQLYGNAFNLVDQGNYPKPYGGPTYAGPNKDMTAAWDQIRKLAGTNAFPGLLGAANQQINNYGMTPAMTAAMSPLQRIASGDIAISTGDDYARFASGEEGQVPIRAFQGLRRAAGRKLAAEKNLMGMARGKMIGESNPYLMENLNTAAQEAADAANAQFSAAGRYGGGANQGVLAQQTGRIFSEGLGAQMNQDIQNQMAANQMVDAAKMGRLGLKFNTAGAIADIRQQNVQNRFQGLAGQTGVEGTNIANQAGAANSMLSHYNTAADRGLRYSALAPSLDAMRYAGADRLYGIGAQQQAAQQGAYNDAQARWNAAQGRNVDSMSWLNSILSGSPYTTAMETQTQPQGSPAAGFLGGALGGGYLGNKILPGWGGAIGAGAGGLLGMFAS